MSIDLTPNERDFMLNLLNRNIAIEEEQIKQYMENYKGNKAELDDTLLRVKQAYGYINNLLALANKLNMK